MRKHIVKNLFTSKKCAFTLAEVLITLGIIGVVAAVTLPTFVQNYKKTVSVNQLKKFVSTFEQGLQKMLADEGVQWLSDLPSWEAEVYKIEVNGQAFVDNFLNKGFINVKNIQTQEGVWLEWDIAQHIQFNNGSVIVFFMGGGSFADYVSSARCDLIKSKGGSMCSISMDMFYVN